MIEEAACSHNQHCLGEEGQGSHQASVRCPLHKIEYVEVHREIVLGVSSNQMVQEGLINVLSSIPIEGQGRRASGLGGSQVFLHSVKLAFG